jgi:hypothetical protein
MTYLVAEFELIRPDGSVSGTRYLPIPDDLPEEDFEAYINSKIEPLAKHQAGWQFGVMTTAQSSANADRRMNAAIAETRAREASKITMKTASPDR